MELVELQNKIVFHQMNAMSFQSRSCVMTILVRRTDLNALEENLVDMGNHFVKITNVEKLADNQLKAWFANQINIDVSMETALIL